MTVKMVKPSGLHAMQHDIDPIKLVQEKVGDLTGVLLKPTEILTGTYIRPEMTSGGIILPKNTGPIKEDEYQGKVSVILAMGAAAFEDDDTHKFYNLKPKIGDWVICRIAYGFMMNINGHPCRIIEDSQISGVIPRPDMVY